MPSLAEQCPDGTYAGGTYIVEGGQCVLTFPCSSSPIGSSSGGSSSGGGDPCAGLELPVTSERCPDGAYATAQYVDEDGQCVLSVSCPSQTSPPSQPSPPAQPVCNGALPDICERCSDGTTACAHYVVEDGQCAVQICSSGAVAVSSPPQAVDAGVVAAADASVGTAVDAQ